MDRLKYFKGMYPHAYDPPVCCKKKYFSTGFGEIFKVYADFEKDMKGVAR